MFFKRKKRKKIGDLVVLENDIDQFTIGIVKQHPFDDEFIDLYKPNVIFYCEEDAIEFKALLETSKRNIISSNNWEEVE